MQPHGTSARERRQHFAKLRQSCSPPRRPLTTRRRAFYHQTNPFLTNADGEFGEVDVSRAVPAQFCRGWVVVLSVALWLVGGVEPRRASGCHVPDRPVLGSRLSWEEQLLIDLGPPRVITAPPTLTHPPCRGEIPHILRSAGASSGVAWHRQVDLEPESPTGTVLPGICPEHREFLGTRLDRPPRPVASCVGIEPAD